VGDPAAFRELVERYAGMVYNIGLRATGDQHTAEDLCQECFLELACKSRTVRENIAGWLHAFAISRSLNIVRSRQRRTRREQAVASDAMINTDSAEWSELQPLIDRALNGLSDDLRLPVIRHYLQGESQQHVAEQLGISQATVSRRLQRGVEQLRKRLRMFGVMTTVAAVTSFLGQSSAHAASTSLTGSLAKIGVGGVGVSIAKSTPGGLLPFSVTFGAIAGNVLLFLFLRGWILLLLLVIAFVLLMRPPSWLRELLRAQAFGRDVAAHPMYPFRRWTWTIPPADWKQQLFAWLCVGFTFGLVAFGNPTTISTFPGFIVAFGLMATVFLAHAVRLAWRVWTLRRHPPTDMEHLPEQVHRWSSWESIVGASFSTVLLTTWLLSIRREEIFSLSTGNILVWSWFVACAVMVVWTLNVRWRKWHQKEASFNNTVSQENNEVDTKPVARRYHVALIGCLILAVVVILLPLIVLPQTWPPRRPRREPDVYRFTKDGTRIRVDVPKAFKPPTPVKGLPSTLVMAASMGLLFSLLLLRRVVKVRDQFPRPAWLPLLAFSVLSVAMGVGLTADMVRTAETGPRDPTAADSSRVSKHYEPVFNPSPSLLKRIRKYATEAAVITVPDEQLSDGWYIHRYDNGFEAPMPNEKLFRDVAIKVGLADVPELESVDALLCRLYMNPFVLGEVDAVCAVYAFCCGNADEARRLNIAWDNRGLCKGRLVIFVFGRKGLRAPSLTDQAPSPSLFEHIQQTSSTSDSEKRPIPVQTP
jgi:RNA polymerase sigma factor (sigma-70 family)